MTSVNERRMTNATIGQLLISIIILVGMIVASYAELRSSETELKVRVEQLEKGREQSDANIETVRIENREDHKEILREIKEMNQNILQNTREAAADNKTAVRNYNYANKVKKDNNQ